MKIRFLPAAVVLAVILLIPANLFACACCAEKGFYSIWNGKPDRYNLEVLRKIDFSKNAELYSDAAGFDNLKGLGDLFANSQDSDLSQFELADSFAAKTWTFAFTGSNGKPGKLTLPLPATMLSYKVDIHDGKPSAGGGPLLYKEWRFKGNVRSGSGFFKSGIVNPTTYFLVLQGRGNACDNAEDFTNWTLEINGKRANYRFMGTLASGKTADSDG